MDAIRKGVPILLEKLKQQEQQLEDERDEIEREEASLMRMIGNKEREMNKLRSDKKAIKARYEAALDDAGRDLRSAQSKKSKAESDKSAATAGAVGGGVGAAFLGILFPPSLLVTVYCLCKCHQGSG